MSEKSNKVSQVTDVMKLLMAMTYKGHKIYIRSIGRDVYLWDAVYNNELYSSYIVMKPAKGKKKLSAEERDEVVKMCYAGAAATIDIQLGVELSETDQVVIDRFEAARKVAEGETQ